MKTGETQMYRVMVKLRGSWTPTNDMAANESDLASAVQQWRTFYRHVRVEFI
jgi:hypothetical protein